MCRKKIFSIFIFGAILAQLLILLTHDQQIRHLSGETQKVVHSRDGFVQVTVDLQVSSMPPIEFKGSGTLISTKDNKNYILTANHLCNPKLPSFITETVEDKQVFVTDFTGEAYPTGIVFNSEIDDLCLLEFIGTTNAVPTPIASQPPEVNEKVFAFASPSGFYAPYVIPFFDGYYTGDIAESGRVSSVYTIPAVGGSSGAAILNDSGEIVGVIHSALVDFHHITLASTHTDVVMFLNEYADLSGVILLEP